MTDTPELPLDFPPPDDPPKDNAQQGEGATADDQAAESANELVDAVETLEHLLETKEDKLLDDRPSDEDNADHIPPEVPLLKDVVRQPGDSLVTIDLGEGRQANFDEFETAQDTVPSEGNPGGSLQSQLIDELRQIIDDGLNRVAATTRAAVAQELKDQRTQSVVLPVDDERRGPPPSDMRTLAQAVDDALEKCGIDLGNHEELYVDLLGDLNAILRGGLELIHRNMEAAVRNRLRQHAEQTLNGLRQLRAEQQQELPWTAPAGESRSPPPPRLEPYPDNGDNPRRPG